MRAVLFLAHHTHWSLAEIKELSIDELSDWIMKIPKLN